MRNGKTWFVISLPPYNSNWCGINYKNFGVKYRKYLYLKYQHITFYFPEKLLIIDTILIWVVSQGNICVACIYFFPIFVDMIGPNIYIENNNSLLAGKDILLTCNVVTELDIRLHWRCLNTTSPEWKNKRLSTELLIHLKAIHNGQRCTCVAQYKNFTTSTFIFLNVSSTFFCLIIFLKYCPVQK